VQLLFVQGTKPGGEDGSGIGRTAEGVLRQLGGRLRRTLAHGHAGTEPHRGLDRAAVDLGERPRMGLGHRMQAAKAEQQPASQPCSAIGTECLAEQVEVVIWGVMQVSEVLHA